MVIFRAYDIRGKYPHEINGEIAFKIGAAFGKFIEGNRIIIGSDARESSPELKKALISGLGPDKEIIDIGLSTTPMFYFAMNHLRGDAGLMITASHLGAEYNGLKLVESGGISFTYDNGIGKIEKMVENEEYVPRESRCVEKDVRKKYLDFIANEKINLNGRIAVDTGNGMMGLLIKDVLERLGIDYIPLYFDIDLSFPNHEANPLKTGTLKELKNTVTTNGAILGVAFDGDGDRIGILDENGKFVPGDILIAIIAESILEGGPEKILYDLRSSKVVPETIEKLGGTPIKSRVGHSFISRRMKKDDIFFGGELSGHFYFKNSFYVESSLMTLIGILKILSSTGKKMSELVEPLKKYHKTEEINFKVKDKKGKLDEIEKIYSERECIIEKIDGLSVTFPEWWFNIRPSNTEDLLRLNLEADTEDLMREKTKEVEDIIKD